MDFSLNKDASFLNANEASVVETVVRAAVVSILKVFCEVNEKRSRCYELKLAETERENAALKIQLQAAERELQTLRHICSNDNTSTETTLIHDLSSEFPEEPREEPVCFHGDSSLVIKEEPSNENTLCLKTEISDETFASGCDYPGMDNIPIYQQTPGAEMWSIQHVQTLSSARSSFNQTRENSRWLPGDVPTGKLKSRECVRRYRERIRSDPEKYHAWKEKERIRSLHRRKRIQDLPEPMQKLQREAWREATRRHRARKMAQATFVTTNITPSLNS